MARGARACSQAWLPPKHKKTLLLSTYKPLLVRCPLFHGLEETIINKASMRMHPYHAGAHATPTCAHAHTKHTRHRLSIRRW